MYEELKNFLKGKDQNFEKELQVIQNSDITHINEYGILTPDENSRITSNLGGVERANYLLRINLQFKKLPKKLMLLGTQDSIKIGPFQIG
jgi:hypothetical protein